MNNKLTALLLVVIMIDMSTSCVFDSECTINGIVNRCVNGQCMIVGECHKDIDCRSRGIYWKCENAKCVSSDRKTCISNDDCKKNKLHKRCVKNHCQIW